MNPIMNKIASLAESKVQQVQYRTYQSVCGRPGIHLRFLNNIQIDSTLTIYNGIINTIWMKI